VLRFYADLNLLWRYSRVDQTAFPKRFNFSSGAIMLTETGGTQLGKSEAAGDVLGFEPAALEATGTESPGATAARHDPRRPASVGRMAPSRIFGRLKPRCLPRSRGQGRPSARCPWTSAPASGASRSLARRSCARGLRISASIPAYRHVHHGHGEIANFVPISP